MHVPPALQVAAPVDSAQDLRPVAIVFHALGHRNRLWLLQMLLHHGPLPLSVLVAGSDSPATVSDHLKVLRAAGFVTTTGHGRSSRWRAVPDSLGQAAALIAPTE